jgi:hypothetical protein
MKEIYRYVESKNVGSFSFLINGVWGSGKTHFISNELNNIKEAGQFKGYYYVSLNGLKSLSSIDDQLIAQKINIDGKFGKIAYGVLKTAGRLILKNNEKVEASEADFEVSLKDIISFNNCLFVFDDLERIDESLNIKTVFGYIHNNFMLNKENKIIYVCDERNISNNEEYFKVKEKYVGWTVSFHQDFRVAVASILENYKELNEKFDKEFLWQAISAIRLFNLRSVIFFFDTLSSVVHILPKEEVVKKCVTYNILVFCKEIREGNIKTDQSIESIPPYLIPVKALNIESSSDSEYPELYKEKVKIYMDNDLLKREENRFYIIPSNELLRLVTSLSVDQQELEKYFYEVGQSLYYNRPTKEEQAINQLYDLELLTSEEYIKLLQSIIKKIEENSYCVTDLVSALMLISDLEKVGDNITSVSTDEMERLISIVENPEYRLYLPDENYKNLSSYFDKINSYFPKRDILWLKFYSVLRKIDEGSNDDGLKLLLEKNVLNENSYEVENILIAATEKETLILLKENADNDSFWIGLYYFINDLDFRGYSLRNEKGIVQLLNKLKLICSFISENIHLYKSTKLYRAQILIKIINKLEKNQNTTMQS